MSEVKTSKGEQTKARIVEAALELFKENGFDETTMRAVAGKADVSLGSAYYYFKSKEQLLQAYYGRVHEGHVARRARLPVEVAEGDDA
ncbi:MAG: helix-turn-helix domain-containing protein, partial [Planctomycetota bacterium]